MAGVQFPPIAAPGVWPAWSAQRALGLPSVGRAIGLVGGLIMQMPMDLYRGIDPQPTPILLERPDPNRSRAAFTNLSVQDLLLHGNTLHLVTSRDAGGWPRTVQWLPAPRVGLMFDVDSQWLPPTYLLDGVELPGRDVIHVARQPADPGMPWRGLGVVEQHLNSLGRVYGEESYEAGALDSGAVPSVALITPDPNLTEADAEAARTRWEELYGGATRRPGVFPAGTDIRPLAWSPTDAQLADARKLSLVDVANMFNLDSYWLGAETSSHTYRSPGPMFTGLVRQTAEPVLQLLEGEWGWRWLPPGDHVRFARRVAERDVLATVAEPIARLVDAGVLTADEARAYLELSTRSSLPASVTSPITTGE